MLYIYILLNFDILPTCVKCINFTYILFKKYSLYDVFYNKQNSMSGQIVDLRKYKWGFEKHKKNFYFFTKIPYVSTVNRYNFSPIWVGKTYWIMYSSLVLFFEFNRHKTDKE